MPLQLTIADGWFWFCIFYGVAIIVAIVMSIQGRQFYTNDDGMMREFSMMDLELASSGQEIKNIMEGIYALDEPQSSKTMRALRGQLWIDFLFMPAVYGAIFLLCMMVSNKMTHAGKYIFAVLAWLQVLPWIADAIENFILLSKTKRNADVLYKPAHKFYHWLEIIKWGLSLGAGVCGLAAVFYFFMSGNYSIETLPYALVIIAELILFVVMLKFVVSKKARVY